MLLAGFYASAEMSIVIWAGNFFSVAHNTTTEKVSIYISIFWLMFTVGRMFGNFQIKKLGGVTNSKIMAGVSLCCLLAVIFLNNFISPIAFILTGLSVATIFPSIHHILNLNKDEEIRGMLNATLFLTVSVSGFVFVPIVGAVAEQNLTIGMLINSIPLIAIMFVLKNKYEIS
jgi:fucose permease